MSASSLFFRVVLFYFFIYFSDGTVQWYDAVNLCKQKGLILHPELTSNEYSLGYRQDTTMWTSSYILSVNNVKHSALYVEQIPITEVHRGLCIDKKNSNEVVVLNIPLNYSAQDFLCSWNYQRLHPESLLNITSLSVVGEVLNVMDFGQKYWLSNISESVYKLVHHCEVFQYLANTTLKRKSYSAMRHCDEIYSYKCIDGKKYRPAVSLVKYLHDRHGNYHERKRTNNSGKKYRPAVSLVKYLHDRHGNYHERKRTNNSGDFVWKVSSLTLSGGIILIGLLVTCLKITRSLSSFKKDKPQLPDRKLNEPVYDDDWVQMKQTSSLKHNTALLPSGSALSANIHDTRTSRKSNATVTRI